MNNRPIIGITMGDPAGIGPEITWKALSNKEMYQKCRPLVIGDAGVMKAAGIVMGNSRITINEIQDVGEARYEYGMIDVYHLDLLREKKWGKGRISAASGEAAYRYVEKVIELALEHKVDATVTNAISKEAIHLAGHPFSGHTEIYAALTGTAKYTMMLALDDIRVVHVSTHVSLRNACDSVKKERIGEVIEIAYDACRKMNIDNPRIGVAGLNPHCGENGLFGREEQEEIIPAVLEARAKGMNVDGPVPGDSIFSKANGGWYDVVVAMYHDQGHIPMKVLGFQYDRILNRWNAVRGVNITLGLPIIRTSVDHGTAFDQAGKGTANELSLAGAIEYAVKLACR